MAEQTGRIGAAEDAILYDDLEFATAAEFPGPIAIQAPEASNHAAQAGSVPPITGGTITTDGGFGVFLINKTGAVSIKGTTVVVGTVIDSSVAIAPADAFDVFGAIAEDGVADGDKVLVAVSGRVLVLLQDNTFTARRHWVRTSPSQPGRVYAESDFPPGEDFADALSITTGNLISGTVADLEEKNGVSLIIQEASGGGGGGFLYTLTFNNVIVIPGTLQIFGRYQGSGAHVFNVEVYNNSTFGWDVLGNMPNDSVNTEFNFDLGATPSDYINGGGQVLVRFNHGPPGIGTHFSNFDQVKLIGPDSEHFKECGHSLENNPGGIDQLVAIMVHFL